MKLIKKLMVVFVALFMVMSMTNKVYAGSITITTDETYEGSDQAYVYDAYKIFDASYESLTGTNTQAAKDPTYTPSDAAVSYFMKTGNPWITTVQGLTTYFTVTAAADGSGYTVVAKDTFDTAAEAKEVAAALKAALANLTLTEEYAAKEITAGGNAVTVDDGYYLIVGKDAANLALVTTDVTIVEKNEYPHLIKEFSDETKVSEDMETQHSDEMSSIHDDVQIGDTVSYTLTVTIPSGANQQMVITDTFTSGLDPVLANGVVKVTAGNFTGTPTVSAPSSGKFTITLSAADVTANAGKTVTFVYEAVVTKDAWYQTEENTGVIKYGNKYEGVPDHVDSKTYHVEIQKKANAIDGDDLGGAKFQLFRTDTDHSLTKEKVYLVKLTDAELVKLGTQDDPFVKAEKTIYYRVASSTETGATLDIDMTEKGTDGKYLYTKAVVYGLDGDSTYYARETQAPEGFNILTEDVELKLEEKNLVQPVVNNSGTVLPSTGGIGTTIFHVAGAALVLGAGIILISKKRVNG